MERPNLIVFDDGPNADYFMCHRCSTHIALRRDLQCFFHSSQRCGGLFSTAENVRADEAVRRNMLIDAEISRLYCRVCDETLGFKYIQVGPACHFQVARGYEAPHIRNGMVTLYIDRLSRRRGDEVLRGDGLVIHILQNDLVYESLRRCPFGGFVALVTP